MTLSNTNETANLITQAILDNDAIADQSLWLQLHQRLNQPVDELHIMVANALQSAHDDGFNDQDYDELEHQIANRIAESYGHKLADTLLPYVHETLNNLP